jgi:hypothetical protein
MRHPDFPEAEIINRPELRRRAAAGWRVFGTFPVTAGEMLTLRNGSHRCVVFLPDPTTGEGAKRKGLAELINALACLGRLSSTLLPEPVRAMIYLGARHLERAQVILAQTPDEPDPMPTARQTSFRREGGQNANPA